MARRFINIPRLGWRRTALDKNGFTLLEVVCALALLGLVALAALAYLGQTLDFWERSGDWGRDERDIRLMDRALEKFVGRLYTGALPRVGEKGFHGDDHSIDGLLVGENGLFSAGILYDASTRSVTFWETENSTGKNMVLEAVDRWDVAYYDPERGWRSAWETQAPLPRAVRIRWSLRQKLQPTLVFPIYGGRSIPPP